MCQTTFFPPLSLSFSFYVLLYTFLFGGKGRGGTRVRILIRALDFFFNSQIFSVTRFIHLLYSAAYAALLIVCNGWTDLVHRAEGTGRGQAGLLLDWWPQLPSARPQNTLMWQCSWESVSCEVSGYLSGMKLRPGEVIEGLSAINLRRSADFCKQKRGDLFWPGILRSGWCVAAGAPSRAVLGRRGSNAHRAWVYSTNCSSWWECHVLQSLSRVTDFWTSVVQLPCICVESLRLS